MSEARDAERKSYPLLPLRNVLVFPGITISLEVGRPKSVKAVEIARALGMELVMCAQKSTDITDPLPEHIYAVGTLGIIKEVAKTASGNLRIVVEGIRRIEISSYLALEPAYMVSVEDLHERRPGVEENRILVKSLMEQYEEYVGVTRNVPAETLISITGISEAGRLCDTVANHIPIPIPEKQELLETVSIIERAEMVLDVLSREIELAGLEKRINLRVRRQIERSQKEYWLREQMKAIQRELGDRGDGPSEAEEFRQKIEKAGLPDDAKERALREVARLEKMPQASAEAVVVRTYLEWLVSLPWNVLTEDTIDIEHAKKILDQDHYGLDEPKERILEYLAIRKLVGKPKGPILCFVGPPGVGKTSLGKSIARALGRRFVRISLGGVRDEAEIRGHRRTYIGALPGRIIQGLRNAGSKNPVFLMDEIDKLASDFRGDPAAALLEVLDPEQNHQFSDHYLEVPFDLSKVMFITTANSSHSIPRPLLDRMEVINLPGYTEEEKIEIGSQFLVPKMVKEHGLTPSNLTIRRDALREIVRSYTREAGVRNLERQVATICRKTAKDVVAGNKKRVIVTSRNVNKYLGIPKFRYGQTEKEDQVGVSLALAVTEFGGDIMPCEVSVVKGKGKLTLTGQLGDVMKESAQAAVSYLRSRSADLGLEPDFYETVDIHVHIPEGAIPKDGPSAGITMACAIASALTGKPVKHGLAMTGEITLRGRVLPVGGVKEKVLAAHRAGVSKVILPLDNKKDLEDIPSNVRNELDIELVAHMDQVLTMALAGGGNGELETFACLEGLKQGQDVAVNHVS
ncbi:MAG: endopeptidase La [Bacillota bacterium]|jgi:ATP-dependent Lon protease|nr:endopeptidase La [Candidatus Fermentithermobacillaceae bacterium]